MKNLLTVTLLSLSLVCLTSAKSVTKTVDPPPQVVEYCEYLAENAYIAVFYTSPEFVRGWAIPPEVYIRASQAYQDTYDRCIADHR